MQTMINFDTNHVMAEIMCPGGLDYLRGFLTFLTGINENATQADSTCLLGETTVVLEKHKIRISKK